MATIHIFTHHKGFIESLDLIQLVEKVGQLGLIGDYSTIERELVNSVDDSSDITVSTYQAKAALALAGRYDEVDAYMQLETTDRITRLKWEYSNFKRSDPSVQQIANALGMTDQELDDLFALAATIE